VSKIVVSSDWHLDHSTYGVQRFGDVAQAVRQTVDAAIAERADLYLFTGDLCDPDDGPWALQSVGFAIEVATALLRRGIASWWLAGNHDVIEDGTGRTTLSPLRALDLPEVRVFEEPSLAFVPGESKFDRSKRRVQLLALPFTATSRNYDPEKVVRHYDEQLGSRAVVAGHMTQLEGAQDGEETTEMPRGRAMKFPLAACRPGWLKINGHWHDRQVCQGVHIQGSVARLTFGEEKNRPGYIVLEI
jgi:DNA repair exonuclease SbcCD nuclease subunit